MSKVNYFWKKRELLIKLKLSKFSLIINYFFNKIYKLIIIGNKYNNIKENNK